MQKSNLYTREQSEGSKVFFWEDRQFVTQLLCAAENTVYCQEKLTILS